MLSLISALVLGVAPLQDSAHVVLVATTDVHGHATAWDYVGHRPFGGGLARVATVIDSLRSRYPGQVLVADAGDLLEGDPFATYFARIAPREPSPVIEAMNLAGYDVATPGNHDFDWGLDRLRQAVADARFPYVSGNIFLPAADALLYPPYRVLQRQGVRIAITGFTTPGVMVWDRRQLADKIRVGPVRATAARTLEAMRRDADVAIALVHSGMDGPSSYDTTAVGPEHDAAALASLDRKPDIVVVGHSHREMRDSVIAGVHFVQPRPFGASVSVVHLDLVRDGGRWRITRIRADLVPTGNVAPSALLAGRLRGAHDSVAAWVNTPIGLALGPMRAGAARAQPTPILELVNQLQRRHTGADLSAASAFDLGAGFDPDTIRVAHVLALYPFDNTLMAVRVSGAQLKSYLEWSARYFAVDAVGRASVNDSVPGYDYDVVSGARYQIDLRRPVGERIQRLTVRGRAVQPGDSFTLALNSHRQTGAGGYDMLRGAPVVYDKGESIPDLLIAEIKRQSPIDPVRYAAQDWEIVPEAPARAVRALFGVAEKPAPVGARDTVVIRVLTTGDLHGSILPGAGELGAAMDSLTAACGCETLRVDAGDAMQGTPSADATAGRAAVAVLNHLGYAAAALGDHDFDWSIEMLRRRAGESHYPWLAANLFDSATGRRPEWAMPYRILPVGGMSVAIIGYITADTKSTLAPERTAGLRFGEGELTIHDVLGDVAARKPALTILLAHAGGACDSVICSGEIVRLADELRGKGVDLIVAGHTHQVWTSRVSGIPILEAGSRGAAVGVADLVKTPAGGLEMRTRIVPVERGRTSREPGLVAALETYRRLSDSLDARPIAAIKQPLVRTGNQFPLGGLLAEARRNLLRADVGLVLNRDIMADLPAGPASYTRLSAVEPDRRNLVRLTLTGMQLRTLLEQVLAGGAGPVAHVAGVQVRYDPKRPADHRVQQVTFQGGRKLRPEERYTLATDEATASDAGGYAMLAGIPAERDGYLDVEALAAFLRRLPQPVAVSDAAGFLSTRH
ncbi:MAG TPA: 5'-nucleotidase C-terminal domain-containing protein [Gemmatimonadales bacterium]|nr:5'-nucleotidase C-terminal domain-containing protein [Gemmatimonadales bacterium]